jgi:hyperosmotically inducible protein
MMPRKDEDIKRDVVDELCSDHRIDASKIMVAVAGGVVTLSGSVSKIGDAAIARASARKMRGVVDVLDDLTVNYVSPPALPGDDELRQRVESTISWEHCLDENEIDVSVNAGTVALKGLVDGYWKKSLAEERVSGIRGVVKVVNQLAVVQSQKVSDEVIAKNIVSKFERDVLIAPENVAVVVSEGVVTLSGRVPTWAARSAAYMDSAVTPGVKDIVNQLEVAE